MRFGLRVNHHAPDNGTLLLEGIKPALTALRQDFGPIPAAIRPHWRDGPHVLVGLGGAGERNDEAWQMLRTAIQSWLAVQPPRADLDVSAHEGLSRSLAAQERVSFVPGRMRPDRLAELGDWQVPAPLETPELAAIRDIFNAHVLDDVFALVEDRLADPASALLGWSTRVVCLEHLRWRDDLRLWPLSPQGQALFATRSSDRGARSFGNLAERLQPPFLERIRQRSLLGDGCDLGREDAAWLQRMQDVYDRLLLFVDSADAAYFRAIHDEVESSGGGHTAEVLAMDPAWLARLMAHPTHFAYRMLINFLYGMFPAIGFTAGQRFFACHLITFTLESAYPDILARATADGLTLGASA